MSYSDADVLVSIDALMAQACEDMSSHIVTGDSMSEWHAGGTSEHTTPDNALLMLHSDGTHDGIEAVDT